MTKTNKETIIAGIDTSCDDTAIAVLKQKNSDFKLVSNIVSSQVKLHRKYGGVYPFLAKREHQKNLVPVFKKALKQAKLLKINKIKTIGTNKTKILNKILKRDEILRKNTIAFLKTYAKPSIDHIGLTTHPGLLPCLWQGINFAKAIGYFWDIPIVKINHLKAHLLVNFLENKQAIKFPAVGLVVSGGHTELFLIKNIKNFKIMGQTLDDAAGECFDKTARILGLSYPGGPEISQKAQAWISKNPCQTIVLPRPMINSNDYNFSFSGLKTAVLYYHQKQSEEIKKSENYIREMCFQIQQSIIDVLIKKTFKLARDFSLKTIILGGGVLSNKELRKQFQERAMKENCNLIMPKKEFCTDNGAMTAVCSWYNKNK